MSDVANVGSVSQPERQVTPEFLRAMAELIVNTLNLEVAAAEILPDDPLYGEGLGLDSIDILEVALVVGKKYGVQIKADSDDNARIFRSLRSLAEHIAASRSK